VVCGTGENIRQLDLMHIRDIQRKDMPLSDRIRRHYAYDLVFGDKLVIEKVMPKIKVVNRKGVCG
jgi:hypothetical protein